jgi:polysaccharide export outer membrane protein
MIKRSRKSLITCACLALFSTWNVAAQETPATAPSPSVSAVANVAPVGNAVKEADESYRIGPGDVIDITVLKQADYSRLGVRVDNNGMIQIPRIEEDLQAACKTARELANDIKAKYRDYLRSPSIYVQVKEYNSQPVAVIGAVNAPGRFQLQRRVRLLELLTFVNGPSDHASGTIHIIHSGEGAVCEAALDNPGSELVSYNLKDTLQAEELSNPFLRPGDIVRLPEADQAYIVGNVKNTNPIVLREPVTLSQAIARAGGLLPDADSEKIRIYRQANGSLNKTELTANLKAINKHKADDIFLQPNDIVDVPGPSGARKFLNGLWQRVMPSITSYPLGVIR